MPTIFDNIDIKLEEGLKKHISFSERLDYCVGYFNLRGWSLIGDEIEKLNGALVQESDGMVKRYVRLMVGMNTSDYEEVKSSIFNNQDKVDNEKAITAKRKYAEDLKKQISSGIPNNKDLANLRKLLDQLKNKKIIVKLFLRHKLHAKLYLSYPNNKITPVIGIMGSSNFTFSGINSQGELNIDVLEQDAAKKLETWFNDRWDDKYCIDITEELISILDNSWASYLEIPPYYIYLKIAYHLSQDARVGLNEYILPKDFRNEMLDFQSKAVIIASKILNTKKGVIIGDVVGLGKTMVASAIAKLFEDDLSYNTLIVCPKNLEEMWKGYVEKYGLKSRIVPHSMLVKELPELKRYKLVIIDESHNFRNNQNKSYKALKDYIFENDCKVILLSATPYNKTFGDLINQIQLFIDDDEDLGIMPEKLITKLGGINQFALKYPNILVRSIKAFELSEYSEDLQQLMRLFLVRRTRSFIKKNYAIKEDKRYYILFNDGRKQYFPTRLPLKAEFKDEKNNQYGKLYDLKTVEMINNLKLPRYELAKHLLNSNEIKENFKNTKKILGFNRSLLFKRLESSGVSFLISLKKMYIKNQIILYSLKNSKPVLINNDDYQIDFYDDVFDEDIILNENSIEKIYQNISQGERVSKVDSREFNIETLTYDLEFDNREISKILSLVSEWDYKEDKKLEKLHEIVNLKHMSQKVLIFTQYADTAKYLFESLKVLGVNNIDLVYGKSQKINEKVTNFSPRSNGKIDYIKEQTRVLITTDVLSEGQNLQDCHIVVNFDLPWALVRLIQRVGRVDRIGQMSDEILSYSFLPTNGVEKVLKLRDRLKVRIKNNAEVVGSDEVFFDGDPINLSDLYSENIGTLDDDDDFVDVTSYAYQIWKNAIEIDPKLINIIPNLQNMIYSSKKSDNSQKSFILYYKLSNSNDFLVEINDNAELVSSSSITILNKAKCEINTPFERNDFFHNEIISKFILSNSNLEKVPSSVIGKKNSAKYKIFSILTEFIEKNKNTIFMTDDYKKIADEIVRFQIKQKAIDIINRQLKIKTSDNEILNTIVELRKNDNLYIDNSETDEEADLKLVCSMGLIGGRK
jgi:superfamily II DNA or RNA helicase